MENHLLVSVGRFEGHVLAAPVWCVRYGIDFGLQVRLVVREKANKHPKRRVVHRRISFGVCDYRRQRAGQIFGKRIGIANASEPERDVALEWRSRVSLLKHVAQIGPTTSKNEAVVARCVRRPFLDVPGHVVGARWSESEVSANSRGPLAAEVAERRDLAARAKAGGDVPMGDGRQTLASELGVG